LLATLPIQVVAKMIYHTLNGNCGDTIPRTAIARTTAKRLAIAPSAKPATPAMKKQQATLPAMTKRMTT